MKLRLKEVLKEKGIKAKELSAIMEKNCTPLSKDSISRISLEKQNPPITTILEIAASLEVHPIELFSWDGFDIIHTENSEDEKLFVGIIKHNYKSIK